VTRRGWRWVVAAVAALLAAWVLAPSAVPIYDGLSNPDEPYRYVQPPPDAKAKKPPTTARTSLPVRSGLTAAAYANSAETGPQISLYLPAGAIRAPGGASSVVVSAEPMAPSAPLPRDGAIVTNVYRITATAGGTQAAVVGTGNQEPTLQMRAPDARQPGPVFERRTATGWERMKTLRVGNDIYQTQAPAFGDWALVRLASSKSSGGGLNMGLLAGGIAFLALAGIIITIRAVRSQRTA